MIQDQERKTLAMLLRHAAFEQARVLEIGCGGGRVTAMYEPIPALTVGIEPDEIAAGDASRILRKTHILCGSGMDAPFADASFDIVLFTLSLHHHPDSDHALAEACRLLRPGGRILVLEPCAESEIQRLCNIFENENHRLERALGTLAGRKDHCIATEHFETDWTFKDFEDVADYAFGYYGVKDNESQRRAMRDFLGQKGNDSPLGMTDTLRLNVLVP
ncbi:class I SAM-dependent methyltransferase [Desulfovibrio oxyclinae]|uniref:class I SAM-dependent methyltransferase n=1 Tax=Desulfovibrio oxyclinae TaxID=63560 RepID=UPI0003650622|nr:class I SAM-dependent methyltransferase [Desulfovibrio oxyclinae]